MEVDLRGAAPAGLTIIETMRQQQDGQIRLWQGHLSRLRRDCAAVGFELDEAHVAARLTSVTRPGHEQRLRLTVDAQGTIEVTGSEVPPHPTTWRVTVSPVRLSSSDPWLSIKSSHRPRYDAARQAMPTDIDEVILLNERGEVCDGTITTVFLRRGTDLLTPPVASGVLPGVLREHLLQTAKAREQVLHPDDLAAGDVFVGNAVRGLIAAQWR